MRKPQVEGHWHSLIEGFATSSQLLQCAVQRRRFLVGAKPTRQLSLQPVAIGAVVEETKPSEPPV
jgi:hypothetical protein